MGLVPVLEWSDVHGTHLRAASEQKVDQVATNEPTGARHEYALRHCGDDINQPLGRLRSPLARGGPGEITRTSSQHGPVKTGSRNWD